jgi:hypothetical protein
MTKTKTTASALIGALCLASTVVIAADLEVGANAHLLPNPKTTPGATNPAITQANISATICKKGWSTKSIRPPASYTTALKRQQIKAWGYDDKKLGDYEEDHLISLELGGAPKDPKNLWPEPYAGKFGARIKDKVEDRLHELVCSGKLTLKQAQSAIVTNWITAYQRYVLNKPKTKRTNSLKVSDGVATHRKGKETK